MQTLSTDINEVDSRTISLYSASEYSRYIDINNQIKNCIESKSGSLRVADNYSEMLGKLSEFVGLPEQNLLPVCGNRAGFEAICQSYSGLIDKVLLVGPVNQGLSNIVNQYGGTVDHFENAIFGAYQIKSTIRHLKDNYSFVYISNPNRYDGSIVHRGELVSLLEYKSDARIILDESFIDYMDFSAAELTVRYDNLIIIRTLSEAIGISATDFEFLISSSDNIAMINHASGFMPSALETIIADQTLDNLGYIYKKINLLKQNQVYLRTALRAAGISTLELPTDQILIECKNIAYAVNHLSKLNIHAEEIPKSPHHGMRLSLSVHGMNPRKAINDIIRIIGDSNRIHREKAHRLILKKPVVSRMKPTRLPAESVCSSNDTLFTEDPVITESVEEGVI